MCSACGTPGDSMRGSVLRLRSGTPIMKVFTGDPIWVPERPLHQVRGALAFYILGGYCSCFCGFFSRPQPPMLETIASLSPDSQSPAGDVNETEEAAEQRVEMDLALCLHCKVSCGCSSRGCSNEGVEDGSRFNTTCLMAWTVLLAIYTWWMLRNTGFIYVAPRPKRHPGYTVGHGIRLNLR